MELWCLHCSVVANSSLIGDIPMQDTNVLRSKHLIQYGLLAFPLAFVGLPLYMHAPEFYASELQLSLVNLGTALLVLRLIDAIQDPWIGSLSDRYSENRLAIMLLGAGLLAAGFWLLFHPSESAPMLHFSLAVFLSTTGFSVMSINFQSLGGLWQCSPAERTRITGWREGIGLLGLIVAAALPTWLNQNYSPAGGFHLLTLIFLPLLALGFLSFWLWFRKVKLSPVSNTDNLPSSWQSINTSWAKSFFGIYLINNVAAAIPGVLVLFFIKDHLQAEQWIGLFLLLYFMSGVLGMPLWQRLSKVHGKTVVWFWSMLLAVLVFGWAFTLKEGDVVPFAIICVLSGLALGADLALPPAILADNIHQSNTQNLSSRAFSLMNFFTKSSLALATGISLPVLGFLGYQPGVASGASTEPLTLMYALVPSIIKLLAVIWLWRFITRR